MDQDPAAGFGHLGHLTAQSLSSAHPVTQPAAAWPTCIQRSSRVFHGDPGCWLEPGHKVGDGLYPGHHGLHIQGDSNVAITPLSTVP